MRYFHFDRDERYSSGRRGSSTRDVLSSRSPLSFSVYFILTAKLEVWTELAVMTLNLTFYISVLNAVVNVSASFFVQHNVYQK